MCPPSHIQDTRNTSVTSPQDSDPQDSDDSDSHQDHLVQEFNYVYIPYRTESITANPQLASVGCIIYNPLRILVCISCQIAIAPIRLMRHRRSNQHHDRSVDQNLVDNLVTTHNLHLLDYFEDNAPKTPVPGIKWENGYVCGINGCTTAYSSHQKMKRHMSKDHQVTRTIPLHSFVQIIFESNGRRYPVTIPPLVQPSSSSNGSKQSPLQIILKQYASNATQLLNVPDDPAVLNPFLTKYRWLNILKGFLPTKIRDWVTFPQDRNFIFRELDAAVDKYYRKICKEMGNDWHTTTLRWINSTKE